jgi:hypothetical protein
MVQGQEVEMFEIDQDEEDNFNYIKMNNYEMVYQYRHIVLN